MQVSRRVPELAEDQYSALAKGGRALASRATRSQGDEQRVELAVVPVVGEPAQWVLDQVTIVRKCSTKVVEPILMRVLQLGGTIERLTPSRLELVIGQAGG